MDMRKLVGRNFARIRKRKGLTQEQVEERSGFSQQYLSGLERGRRNPTVVTLLELARATGRQPRRACQARRCQRRLREIFPARIMPFSAVGAPFLPALAPAPA